MNQKHLAAAIALAWPLASQAQTQAPPPAQALALATATPTSPRSEADDIPSKEIGMVSVTASRPTSLPTQIPTTMHSITREDIADSINATDSEDALKYFPSLLVRKRYIGDYNHAILSSRASGTGNSARSAVYADGILLSNYLGNGVSGLSFPPRWGLVTPEEIERVDVMYGPFSASYPGNAVGAVVDYVTRMPKQLEAHVKVGYVSQPFDLYDTHTTYRTWQSSASLGSREGAWSWWLNLNHTDSQGQPLTFPTRLLSNGVANNNGTAVTGATLDANNANQPWYVLGSATQYNTQQDHLKVKLAYDVNATLRASYVLGLWQNESEGKSVSYLRNAAGQPVTSGPINIGGLSFTDANASNKQALTGGDFPVTREKLLHAMHGFSLKQNTRGEFDWEIAASLYDYVRDDKRQNASGNVQPAALTGGAGTLADGSGTGWHNVALKGTWRPDPARNVHVVDVGYQLDDYQLRYKTMNLTGNYLQDGGGSLVSNVSGRTSMQSLYAQDTWKFYPRWKTVLGLRAEQWEASDGRTDFSASNARQYPTRRGVWYSPKGALSWQWLDDTVLKASVGRAVRMPTVGELYGATAATNSQYINDPNLRPERSRTTELSAEKDMGQALARLTWFTEQTRDALYSQTVYDASANKNISRVQNIDHIATSGLEMAASSEDALLKGLQLQGSVTYTDSKIKANRGFVTIPGDTVCRWQPNIPRWRATVAGTYRLDDHWSGTLGLRYSGRQYRTLNNSDVNGSTYMGVSQFVTADLRIRHRFNKQWSAALGIDNLNNKKYWNFHPYPQRSYSAELSFDL